MFSKAYDCSEFTPESIVFAGEKALVYLNKGKLTDNLDYHVLPESCTKQTIHQVGTEVLTPTPDHGLRVFYPGGTLKIFDRGVPFFAFQ